MTTRLFHISDVHFGVEDRAALDAVARAVAEEKPDALVVTGDLTQRAKHSEYAAAARWLGQIEVPVWLDPGNHDMPYYNLWERFSDPFGRFHKLRAEVAVERFETDDLVLVPLNTNIPAQRRWPWSDGVVTAEAQARTLQEVAGHEADGRWLIVTAHHPLHGPKPGGPNATIGGDAAYSALVEAGIDAVLSGHIHTPFNEYRRCDQGEGGAQVIGAGTLSTRLRHGAPPSYNVLTCTRRGAQAAGKIEGEIAGEIHVEQRALAPSPR